MQVWNMAEEIYAEEEEDVVGEGEDNAAEAVLTEENLE